MQKDQKIRFCIILLCNGDRRVALAPSPPCIIILNSACPELVKFMPYFTIPEQASDRITIESIVPRPLHKEAGSFSPALVQVGAPSCEELPSGRHKAPSVLLTLF